MEPEQINRSQTILFFMDSLIVLSQSANFDQRQQAQAYLQKLTTQNTYLYFEMARQVFKICLHQLQHTYKGMTFQNIAILNLCYLKQLFLSKSVKLPSNMVETLQQFYDKAQGSGNRLESEALECFEQYLNAPGNIRVKRDYLMKSIQYLISEDQNNFTQSKIILLSKVLRSPREHSDVRLGMGKFSMHIQILIKQKYNRPLGKIPDLLWKKIIVGLINYSNIPPSTEFLITSLLSWEDQNIEQIDLTLYFDFLKLYQNSSYGHINQNNIFHYDYKILISIIRKLSMGILNRVAEENIGVQAIERLLGSLQKALSDCLGECKQNQQARQSNEGRQITNFDFFVNLALLLTSILDYTQKFEQQSFLCNKGITGPVSQIMKSMVEYYEQGKFQWISKLYNHFQQQNDELKSRSLILLLSTLPRAILEEAQCTGYIVQEISAQEPVLIKIVQQTYNPKQIEKIICFLGLIEHYVDAYKYINSKEVLQKIDQFVCAITQISFQENYSSLLTDKICVMKTFAINILCRLEKFYQKEEAKLCEFFQQVVWTTAETLKRYDNAKDSSIILQKIKEGIESLVKLGKYRPVIFLESIYFQEKLIFELMGAGELAYKQKINFLAIQMLHLTSQTFEHNYFCKEILQVFGNYFQIIVKSPYLISLEQPFLQLYQKILFEVNSKLFALTCENSLDTKKYQTYVEQLESHSQMLNYILKPQTILNADTVTLNLYVRIILELMIHSNFSNFIINRLLQIYQACLSQPSFNEIVETLNLIWEAAVILYGWIEKLDQFQDLQFYQRIVFIRDWELEKLLAQLNIDPEDKRIYECESIKDMNEYKYKWSKLPQVKKVIHFGSAVNQCVDQALANRFS